MLTSLNNENHVTIFLQAHKIVGFDFIKNTFLDMLLISDNFSVEQKLAIQVIAGKMTDTGHMPSEVDEMMLKILNIDWSAAKIETDAVTALTKEQREGIFQGILNVCRGVIFQEAQRLSNLGQLDTTLPYIWHHPYGYGYGYDYEYGQYEYGNGYDGVDFFQVFQAWEQ